VKIGSHDTEIRCFIIAEIGNNHEGDFGLATELIHQAASAGVDAVKFQTIIPEKLVSPDQTQRIQQLKRFQFTIEQFAELSATAAKAGLIFMSTPFNPDVVRLLDPLVPAFKIASGDNDYHDLLTAVAATGKPIIMSAGMTDRAQIKRSVEVIEGEWERRRIEGELALLHCVVSYPTPVEDANLAAIRTLQELDWTVGYSDHTLGIDAAVLSVALGARIVEKHFTISKTHSEFRDHQLSADPTDMAEMVRRIRLAETLLGHPEKQVLAVEGAAAASVRRSVRATANLPAGTILAAEHLICLRPGDGLPASEAPRLIGKRLARAVTSGTALRAEDIA